jgi:hypothetical protein
MLHILISICMAHLLQSREMIGKRKRHWELGAMNRAIEDQKLWEGAASTFSRPPLPAPLFLSFENMKLNMISCPSTLFLSVLGESRRRPCVSSLHYCCQQASHT